MTNRDFDPFDVFRQLEDDIRGRHGANMQSVVFHPKIDMYETDNSLVVKMELAGVQSDSIRLELSADDRTICIEGERLESREDHSERLRCYHLEIFYGKFERTVSLPASIRLERERITAELRDGFLVVTLPKAAQKATLRRSIKISSE